MKSTTVNGLLHSQIHLHTNQDEIYQDSKSIHDYCLLPAILCSSLSQQSRSSVSRGEDDLDVGMKAMIRMIIIRIITITADIITPVPQRLAVQLNVNIRVNA